MVLLDAERVAFRGISRDGDGNGAVRAIRIYRRLKSGFCPGKFTKRCLPPPAGRSDGLAGHHPGDNDDSN